MAKLLNGIVLLAIIMQVHSMDTLVKDNSTEFELEDEGRLLIGSIIAGKCNTRLYTPSPVAPTTTISLTRLSNNRLYYFSPAGTILSFEAANTFCKDHGMHLVTINSEAENLLVHSKLVELGLTVATPGVWIGYRDVSGTNNYQWVQPKVGKLQTYFRNGFPDVGECAWYLDLPTADPLWRTAPCRIETEFVCEMEPPCSLVL